MRKASQERRDQAPFEIEWLDASAESIPLPDDSVDSVVLTYTLCTIPDPQRALAEMRRVLRPGGELLFCEHGLAPDGFTGGLQRAIDPVWHRFAGGCHLNRKMSELLEGAGFELEGLQEEYARKVVRFLGYTSTGIARAR
jgi:ubiquinone/menaquinone biosynthesis C-methylase UbiE